MLCSLLRLEGAKGFDRVAGQYSVAAELVESVRRPAADEKGDAVERFESSSEFLLLLEQRV